MLPDTVSYNNQNNMEHVNGPPTPTSPQQNGSGKKGLMGRFRRKADATPRGDTDSMSISFSAHVVPCMSALLMVRRCCLLLTDEGGWYGRPSPTSPTAERTNSDDYVYVAGGAGAARSPPAPAPAQEAPIYAQHTTREREKALPAQPPPVSYPGVGGGGDDTDYFSSRDEYGRSTGYGGANGGGGAGVSRKTSLYKKVKGLGSKVGSR